jgi:hypothetical protein
MKKIPAIFLWKGYGLIALFLLINYLGGTLIPTDCGNWQIELAPGCGIAPDHIARVRAQELLYILGWIIILPSFIASHLIIYLKVLHSEKGWDTSIQRKYIKYFLAWNCVFFVLFMAQVFFSISRHGDFKIWGIFK